jgi:hypothetical protein
MKRQGLVSVLGLLVLGVASHTLAEPPADAAERTRVLERRAEQARERLKELGVPVPSSSTLLPSGVPSGPMAAPSGSAVPGADHLAEVARRWKVRGEDRLQRRERSRAALVRQHGPRLSDPRVRDELKLHATRVAELARLQFLAENARTGPDRDKLLARIRKLSGREAERHQKQLAKLTATSAGAPAGSANPAPSEAKP